MSIKLYQPLLSLLNLLSSLLKTAQAWILPHTHLLLGSNHHYLCCSNSKRSQYSKFMLGWSFLDLWLFLKKNTIDPQLHAWGVLSAVDKMSLFVEDFIYDLIPEVSLKYTIFCAVIYALKFLTLIALLVFVRGGIPRYRYDFLTKIGWIKFLSLVLAVFLSTLLLALVF